MKTCCNLVVGRKRPVWTVRVREVIAWAVPSAVLALVPKCPACLAAYVVLWTGLGLSFTTATYLRWAMLLVGVAAMIYLTATRGRRVGAIFNQITRRSKNAEPNC